MSSKFGGTIAQRGITFFKLWYLVILVPCEVFDHYGHYGAMFLLVGPHFVFIVQLSKKTNGAENIIIIYFHTIISFVLVRCLKSLSSQTVLFLFFLQLNV